MKSYYDIVEELHQQGIYKLTPITEKSYKLEKDINNQDKYINEHYIELINFHQFNRWSNSLCDIQYLEHGDNVWIHDYYIDNNYNVYNYKKYWKIVFFDDKWCGIIKGKGYELYKDCKGCIHKQYGYNIEIRRNKYWYEGDVQ